MINERSGRLDAGLLQASLDKFVIQHHVYPSHKRHLHRIYIISRYDAHPQDQTSLAVISFSLSDEWNLISRTILPVIHQDEIFPSAGDQTGIGDVVQSLFLSPASPTFGWIWGAGPVFLLPTGSDRLLTADKWGAGPTAVALRQQGPWTYGALVNHIWSFAGDGDRADFRATFLQPFVSYTTSTAWSFAVNTESSYDWENEDWSVPINATISKVTKVGGQMVSFTGGLRYWATTPDSGPERLGFRFTVTLLFPK